METYFIQKTFHNEIASSNVLTVRLEEHKKLQYHNVVKMAVHKNV